MVVWLRFFFFFTHSVRYSIHYNYYLFHSMNELLCHSHGGEICRLFRNCNGYRSREKLALMQRLQPTTHTHKKTTKIKAKENKKAEHHTSYGLLLSSPFALGLNTYTREWISPACIYGYELQTEFPCLPNTIYILQFHCITDAHFANSIVC